MRPGGPDGLDGQEGLDSQVWTVETFGPVRIPARLGYRLRSVTSSVWFDGTSLTV